MENNIYKINSTHNLHPDYIQEMHDGRKYVIFKETNDGRPLRVKALEFLTQPDAGLPSTIDVTVCAIDVMSGMPIFKVNRNWLIKILYGDENLPKKYSFTIIQKINKDDYKSLFIKDGYGVTHYFPIEQDDSLDNYSEGERITLLATEIKNNAKGGHYLFLSKPSVDNPIAQYILAFTTSDNISVPETTSQTTNLGDESDTIEFKQSLVYHPAKNSVDAQIFNIMRSIAGFMNNIGGTLYIGVKDDGITINGIENDFPKLNEGSTGFGNYTANWDGWNRMLIDSIRQYLGTYAASLVTIGKMEQGKRTFAKIIVQKSPKPIFVNNKFLFRRQCNTTSQLCGDELTWFILERLRGDALEQFIAQKYGYETEVIEDTDNIETYEVSTASTTDNIANGAIEEERNHNKWLHLRFFKDGHYMGTPLNSNALPYKKDVELVCEYQLEQYHKNEDQVLLMIYNDSGKVNKIDFELGSNNWYHTDKRRVIQATQSNAPWITEQHLIVECVDRNDMLVAFYNESDKDYCYVRDVQDINPSQSDRSKALFTGGHKMLPDSARLIGKIMHIPGSYRNWIAPIVNKRVELDDSKKKGTIRRMIDILEDIYPMKINNCKH